MIQSSCMKMYTLTESLEKDLPFCYIERRLKKDENHTEDQGKNVHYFSITGSLKDHIPVYLNNNKF